MHYNVLFLINSSSFYSILIYEKSCKQNNGKSGDSHLDSFRACTCFVVIIIKVKVGPFILNCFYVGHLNGLLLMRSLKISFFSDSAWGLVDSFNLSVKVTPHSGEGQCPVMCCHVSYSPHVPAPGRGQVVVVSQLNLSCHLQLHALSGHGVTGRSFV